MHWRIFFGVVEFIVSLLFNDALFSLLSKGADVDNDDVEAGAAGAAAAGGSGGVVVVVVILLLPLPLVPVVLVVVKLFCGCLNLLNAGEDVDTDDGAVFWFVLPIPLDKLPIYEERNKSFSTSSAKSFGWSVLLILLICAT